MGAYLLGALPEVERQAFEHHVMGCPDCRDEIERLRPAVEALPRSVAPLNPPPRLRRTLMAEVARDARGGEPAPRRGALAGLASRLRRRAAPAFRRARPATAWVSAAFLLAAGVVAGYGATRLLDADGDRTYRAAFDQSRLSEASGTLPVPDDSGRTVLSVHGVPALPSRRDDRVYHLWVVRGAEVIPSSLMTVARDGSGTAAIPEGVDDADAVLVTRERIGGAQAPSEEPVMRIDLG